MNYVNGRLASPHLHAMTSKAYTGCCMVVGSSKKASSSLICFMMIEEGELSWLHLILGVKQCLNHPTSRCSLSCSFASVHKWNSFLLITHKLLLTLMHRQFDINISVKTISSTPYADFFLFICTPVRLRGEFSFVNSLTLSSHASLSSSADRESDILSFNLVFYLVLRCCDFPHFLK